MSWLRDCFTRWAPTSALVALAGALFLAGIPAAGAQATSGQVYQLHIDCPELLDAGIADPNSLICPIKAIDEDDMMGSPSIAVDPDDPQNLILASLHGGDAQGPTERSRNNQPFTTFISINHGAEWSDNPYYPPQSLRGSFGEHPQASIDDFGHIYIGSLYSTPDDGAPSGYTSTIVAQKFADIFQTDARQQGEWGAQFLDPYYDGNVIPEFWFVWDNVTDTMTLVWNERVPVEEEPPADLASRGVGLPLETAASAFGRSVIGMAWSTPRGNDPWHYIDEDHLVGPCNDTSNPVIADGQIYIACRVDVGEGGYPWDEDAVEDQIDLFRMDVKTGVPEYLGQTPVTSGTPRLAVREDGRLALLSAGVGADGNTKVVVAFGWAEKEASVMHWTDKRELGDKIARATVGSVVTEARIQDAVIREDSGVVHFILKEQYENLGRVLEDPGSFLRPRYVKTLVAISEDGQDPLKTINLDVGNLANRTGFPTKINPFETDQEAVFNDLTDDIILFPPGHSLPPGYEDQIPQSKHATYQREFIAYGDYGIVMFAEIIEITDEEVGAVPAGIAVVPTIAPALVPTAVITGVALTALAVLLALKLALNRRTTESVAITKGGK